MDALTCSPTRPLSGPGRCDWARAAIRAYRRHEADRIVVEVNQGGDLVETVIRQVDAGVPVRAVRAVRGKWLRAEPVAALYEQGRVAHVGAFPELEDEMSDFGPDGLSGGRSPDRVDALVWALTELLLRERPEPRVRFVVDTFRSATVSSPAKAGDPSKHGRFAKRGPGATGLPGQAGQ